MFNLNEKEKTILDELFELEKDRVKNSLESYIDRVNIIGAYENEKFYKIRICRCSEFDNWMYQCKGIGLCFIKRDFNLYF